MSKTEFNGEIYNDDRMYVLYLSKCTKVYFPGGFNPREILYKKKLVVSKYWKCWLELFIWIYLQKLSYMITLAYGI